MKTFSSFNILIFLSLQLKVSLVIICENFISNEQQSHFTLFSLGKFLEQPCQVWGQSAGQQTHQDHSEHVHIDQDLCLARLNTTDSQ